MLASIRERAAIGARFQYTVEASAGDCVTMGRTFLAGGPDDGRFEMAECNENGKLRAFVLFDLHDRESAGREMRERGRGRA